MSASEKQIVYDFIHGSDYAFTSIYNAYVDVLLSYGTGLGFEREVLKDAIQDVFMKLYINRRQLADVQNLKFYLFRSLKNRLLDIQKSLVELNDIADYESNFSVKTTILDEMIEGEDKIAIQQKIDRLLSALTARQREAIYLRFLHEMEYDEIAQLLDMTPQACRKLVFRGIKRIRNENIGLFLIIVLLYTLDSPAHRIYRPATARSSHASFQGDRQ
ncbi:MAG: sigma-70 family RNA polymerase sigma factor [Dysgonamonadaceae bacterium]|jgi:RNA polymerase sigma factor (sigma-70 family)|nr:sigma-70 family RNA polymerase sigma factor [Dysgonamonadaceae bacterium]